MPFIIGHCAIDCRIAGLPDWARCSPMCAIIWSRILDIFAIICFRWLAISLMTAAIASTFALPFGRLAWVRWIVLAFQATFRCGSLDFQAQLFSDNGL
jgi:hypothetical protein